MSENAATAGPSTSEAVEELLGQLVDARFVLTDRDGAVTRWSRPAEELFGWPGARMLGRLLVETLELGIGLPETGGRLQARARRKDGRELELALTFVPVRMSQSLEFNGFLEALEIVAPRGNALGQLQASHKTVVDWIAAAVAGEAEIEEEGLAAGTIVAFRPLEEPPPPALDSGDEPVAASLRRPDVVERLLEDSTHAELAAARTEAETLRGEAKRASARLQQLEEAGAEFGSELADSRGVLEEMAAQVEGLRGELERTRAAGEEQAREELERLRRDAEDGQAERERLRRQLDELQGTVEELRRDLGGAPAEQPGALREELTATRERIEELARERDTEGERLDALQQSLEGGRAEDDRRLRGELEDLRGRVTELGEDAGRERQLRTELEETRRLVGSLGARIEEVQVEAVGDEEARILLSDLREELREAAASSKQAQSAIERLGQETLQQIDARAVQARETVAQIDARVGEAREALAAIEAGTGRAREATAGAETLAARAVHDAGEALQAVESASAHARNTADEIGAPAHGAAGALPDDSDPRRPLFGRKRDIGPARQPRPGFDDVKEPKATIELDGHFRELNQAFTDLVGYSEEDFRSAGWPPVMDRANLPKHREQMKLLLAGEIDSAEVNTGYVHAQGLLVPVIGTMSLVRSDGEPDHFLLSAKS